jgi:hypothetical protein
VYCYVVCHELLVKVIDVSGEKQDCAACNTVAGVRRNVEVRGIAREDHVAGVALSLAGGQLKDKFEAQLAAVKSLGGIGVGHV